MGVTYRQSTVSLIMRLVIDCVVMFIIIGFFLFIRDILNYLNSSLTIEEKMLVIKNGTVSTSSTEVPYSKINSINVRESIVGKMLGYGDLVVSTGNDVSGIVFKGVQSPQEAKKAIQARMS